MKRSVKKKGQAGFATVLALSILALAAIIGGALMLLMPQVEATGERYASTMTAKNAAEAGFRRAVAEMEYAVKHSQKFNSESWLSQKLGDATGYRKLGDGSSVSPKPGEASYSVTVQPVKITGEDATHVTQNSITSPTDLAGYLTNYERDKGESVYYLVTSQGQYTREHEFGSSASGTEYATVFGYVTLAQNATTKDWTVTELKEQPDAKASVADDVEKLIDKIEDIIKKDPTQHYAYKYNVWNKSNGYILVSPGYLYFSSEEMFEALKSATGWNPSNMNKTGNQAYYSEGLIEECYVKFDDPTGVPLIRHREKNRDWWWTHYQINITDITVTKNANGKVQDVAVDYNFSAAYGRYDYPDYDAALYYGDLHWYENYKDQFYSESEKVDSWNNDLPKYQTLTVKTENNDGKGRWWQSESYKSYEYRNYYYPFDRNNVWNEVTQSYDPDFKIKVPFDSMYNHEGGDGGKGKIIEVHRDFVKYVICEYDPTRDKNGILTEDKKALYDTAKVPYTNEEIEEIEKNIDKYTATDFFIGR